MLINYKVDQYTNSIVRKSHYKLMYKSSYKLGQIEFNYDHHAWMLEEIGLFAGLLKLYPTNSFSFSSKYIYTNLFDVREHMHTNKEKYKWN